MTIRNHTTQEKTMHTTRLPIVAGIDGSKHSLNALRWAVNEAVLRSAPLKLMTWPYEISASLAYYSVSQEFYNGLKKSAEDTLDEGCQMAESIAAEHGQKLELTKELMSGPVRPGLIEASSTAQMVVVGPRGHGVLVAEILGSVTSALVEHSHSSVVIVSNDVVGAETIGPVVVGIDGSDSSAAAMAMAFDEASLRVAELVAVHGYDSRTPRFDEGFVLSWPEVETSEEALLATELATLRGQYPDVAVSAKVSPAGAVPALQNAAESASLLVVGTRGRGGFAGLLLGSTSRALLHSVDCPVMIVRAK